MPILRTGSTVLCLLLTSAALVGGCASAPRAAAPAPSIPMAQAAGVSLSISCVEAGGHPGGVSDAMALYVVIENQGAQEIVIAKEDFAIGALDGPRHAALYPAYLASAASWTSSSLRGRRGRASRFGGTLYLPPSRQQVVPARLPTDSLPDGTLGPGGRAAGYLYFPRVGPGRPLRLEWRVRDEASQRPLAELTIQLSPGSQ